MTWRTLEIKGRLKMLKTFAIILIVTIAQTSAQGFCGLRSCNGKEHIDCTRGDGSLGPECAQKSDIQMINLASIRKNILQTLNTFRNQIAVGKKSPFSKAVRMGQLRWNATLATLARRNVRNCVSTLDRCRNTPDYDYVGQVIGNSTRGGKPLTDVVRGIITSWINELPAATMADFNQYSGIQGRIDNVAQILRDDACRLGCGALKLRESSNQEEVVLLACNFDVGTVYNYPIYKAGPTASKCQNGAAVNYKGLCKLTEPIKPNSFWK